MPQIHLNQETDRPDRFGAATDTAVYAGPAAQAWFAGGERVGYDPKARAIVAAQDAPLRIFLSREGDLAQAASFLPGFPDGSFGRAKVRPHLPNAAAMPKLFVDYVGMGGFGEGSRRATHVAIMAVPVSPARRAAPEILFWFSGLRAKAGLDMSGQWPYIHGRRRDNGQTSFQADSRPRPW